MEYNLQEHIHRYAIWTAARAAQRSFTTTAIISRVINETGLRSFAESSKQVDQDQFDELQRTWCHSMIKAFENLGLTASYGRVSKIIAIYLKTAVVIGADLKALYLHVIHPPVDRTILKKLPVEMKEFRNIAWTQISEPEYWHMVSCFRSRLNCFDWRLEMLWVPEQADD